MAQDSGSKPASQATLREAMNAYLQSLRPDTRRSYEHFIRRFVDYMGGDFAVSQLTSSRVESYAEQQVHPTDPNAQDQVTALKAWFLFLRKKDYVAENYGVHIRVRRQQRVGAGRTAAQRSAARRLEEPPVEMTAEGIAALRQELAEIEAQIPDLERAISHAREDGDLRENAPYHAAREALAFKKQRKAEIEKALKRAVTAERPGSDDDRSALGSTVVVVRLDKGERTAFKLVGAQEANARERKISVESPVGKQLLGRRPGEEVEVVAPSGPIHYRIEAVTH